MIRLGRAIGNIAWKRLVSLLWACSRETRRKCYMMQRKILLKTLLSVLLRFRHISILLIHAFVHFQSANTEGLSIHSDTANVEIVYIIHN
jgi:hypothetical protein